MKKLIMILTCILASVGLSVAQTTRVSGTVIDDTGETVIGASVVAKGTTVGIITDLDGKFSFNIPSDKKILVISLIGMKTKEVAAGTDLKIVLDSDSKLMDEVVVTGYGVQKKASFTGSATTIKADVMTDVAVTSPDKALQGNAPGLLTQAASGQPGAGQRIVIRGIGSINAGTEPLWIIDGVPVVTGNIGQLTSTSETTYSDNSNALAGINPNDIESVTVLKDAAATSIYGSRAANGVILITTRSGKEGKTVFSLNTNYGWSSRATKKYKVMNQGQYLDYITDARVNAGLETTKEESLSYIKKRFPTDANGNLYNYDWVDEAYRVAPTFNLNFQASGGNAKTKYFMSLGYLDQEGILEASDMNRISTKLNLNHSYSDRLRFGMNTALSLTKTDVPLTTSGYYANPVLASAILPAIDPGKIDGEIRDLTLLSANFLANVAYDKNKQRVYNVLTSAYAEYDILKGLTFKSLWGVNYMQVNETEWSDPRSPGNTASDPSINGRAIRTSGESLIWNTTNTLSYNTTFDKIHNLNLLVGQEAQSDGFRYFLAEGEGFAPGEQYKELNGAANPSKVNGGREDVKLASFLSNVNYNYNNRYMLSASFRRDGSSRFSKKNRYSSFWSVGGQWRISSEEFMKGTEDWLSSLALRASYGTTGNSNIITRKTVPVLDGKYAAIGIFRPGANYNGVSGIYPYQTANENLKWEKSESFNIGIDFSFFNNRLNGSIEYYNKNTNDLLLSKPISSTTGFTVSMQNVGKLRNRGVELSLNAVPIATKDFEWSINFNISHNKNKVLELYNKQDIIIGTRIYSEGEDMQSIYTYKWAGVDPEDGNPMWYAADGSKVKDYTKAEKQIVGSAAPDFFGGLTNTFKFKNFDLSALLYFNVGNDISDQTLNMTNSYGAKSWFNQSEEVVNRWRQPGDVTNVPKVVFGDTKRAPMSSKYVYNGSYLRLRNLNVGYTVPQIKGLRVYFQGTNLLTFTKYKGLDPEVGINGNPWFGYPVAKTITFGLDYKF